jgi:hypothetical protein
MRVAGSAGSALLLLLASCGEGEGQISHRVVPTCVRVPEATERVFGSAEEWRRFVEEHGGRVSDGGPVDFGRFVLAARFDGYGSACTSFTVESVAAEGGRVTIRATRHLSPDPCIAVLAYPQLAVALDRRNLPVVFRIAESVDRVRGETRPCF